MWCPRREENGMMPGPNGEPPRVFPEEDEWRSDRTCSYCGSLSPEAVFEAVEEGITIGPTDKSYKIYLTDDRGSQKKAYFQHFSLEDRKRFLDLLNGGDLKLGHPGRFYVLPYFIKVGADPC